MEHKEEYHDPDYPEASVNVKEEPPSEDEKIQKIKNIFRREFRNELSVRENEVMLIDQRMTSARRYLQQVRYALVNNYYSEQKLQLTNSQIEDDVAAQTDPRARAEVASILRDSQRRLHPSLRKLLGKKTVDLDEIFRSREPRNKTKMDYSGMVQKKTLLKPIEEIAEVAPITEDPTSSKPKKIPRQMNPKLNNIVTLDEATRNKKKHRYRIIIGNTSKYAPPASAADRSTHKWLLYVRLPPPHCAARLLRAVAVRLHRSYAPHHVVHIDKPPFQVSRRGWGEFPARVTLHFTQPDINRPATLTHHIKLDKHYTGLQTLGAETIADVWLYSTPEMLECEFKPEEEPYLEKPLTPPKDPGTIKEEPVTIKEEPKVADENVKIEQNDDWLDFFSKDTSNVNVDEMFVKNVGKEPKNEVSEDGEVGPETEVANEVERTLHTHLNGEAETQPKKRIMKYMDPTTRKIYYLEMDRQLDLSKVKEIVINPDAQKKSPMKNGVKTKRVSLLKPEVKQQLMEKTDFRHIENDHCYLKSYPVNWFNPVQSKERFVDGLKTIVSKFSSVRVIVNYLLKKLPLIRDVDSDSVLPFMAKSEEWYWKLDFAKRRNMEWSRAKLINKILNDQFKAEPAKVWRTKQILVFSRLHGFYPVRIETAPKQGQETDEWSSWDDLENSRKTESNIRKLYPSPKDMSSLSLFCSERYSQNDETIHLSDDEEIDIVGEVNVKVKSEVNQVSVDDLIMLPVDKDDKLKYFFIEAKCSDIGIELRNENIGEGYSCSAVHAVMLSAMKNFAEDLLRSSLADQLSYENDPHLPTIWTGSQSRASVRLEHVWRSLSRGRARGSSGLSLSGLAHSSK